MIKLTTSREIRLASRPKGVPTAANFTGAESTLPPLRAQQVLVRNLFMSVDPYMRGRMNEGKSYVPHFEIGQLLEGGAIGEVVASRANEFKPGDAVVSRYGWRERATFLNGRWPKAVGPNWRVHNPTVFWTG